MLDRGYITSYNSDGEKRQLRIYYQITPAGRDHLKALMDAYGEAHTGYQTVLTATQARLLYLIYGYG